MTEGRLSHELALFYSAMGFITGPARKKWMRTAKAKLARCPYCVVGDEFRPMQRMSGPVKWLILNW